MSDTRIPIFNADGQTAYIDYRSESTNGDGRQVITLGDPSSNNAVASVQATDPSSNVEGLVVRDVNTSAIAAFLASSLAVYLQATAGTLNVQLKPGTIAVSLDPGHLLGAVTGSGTFGVYVDSTQGTLNVQLKPGTIAVSLDPGHELGSIKGNTNTLTVFIPDTGHTLGKVDAGTGTFQVFLPDTGHEIGTIRGNTNTLTVFLPDTGHTLGKVDAGLGTFGVNLGKVDGTIQVQLKAGTLAVSLDPGYTLGKVNAGTGTFAVSFDPGYTLGKVDQGVASTTQAWLVNMQSTLVVPIQASGSSSAVSVSGKTIAGPTASRNIKVFAFSITTTAQTSLTAKITNGSGTSPVESWRWAMQAPTQGISGANMAVTPPGFLFALGTGNTMALVLDSASLVHYSFSYFEESA